MRRIKLIVAYDGSNYSGWQIQPNAKTIEGCLDKAIEDVTGEKIHVIGASRTDAGVHALGNVAVFDTESRVPGEKFVYALNAHLPADIRVMSSAEVKPDFHPRHCDTIKEYEYKIINSKVAIPQYRNYAYHVYGELDIDKMREAAGYLCGHHDFVSFCSVHTQAESTFRTIYSIKVEERNSAYTPLVRDINEGREREILIRVSGNGFLYNMVRIIAGTLIGVGKGKYKPSDVKDMLEAKDRRKAGETAIAAGLTLRGIEYI